jgi:hypothetical protein
MSGTKRNTAGSSSAKGSAAAALIQATGSGGSSSGGGGGAGSNASSLYKNIAHDTLIKTSPFLNDFIDCIENLPNKLQLLLSELRSVDVQVKGITQIIK